MDGGGGRFVLLSSFVGRRRLVTSLAASSAQTVVSPGIWHQSGHIGGCILKLSTVAVLSAAIALASGLIEERVLALHCRNTGTDQWG
jgi:hypothetical protein